MRIKREFTRQSSKAIQTGVILAPREFFSGLLESLALGFASCQLIRARWV